MSLFRRESLFPILMYHRVDPGKLEADPCLIPESAFATHLQTLTDAGYSGWTIDKLLQTPRPAKAAAVTFDDGYTDNYTYAFPRLMQAGSTATFFIITGRIGESGFMTWPQLRELKSNGMSIQSHTVSHLPLGTLSRESVRRELQASKAALEDGLGAAVNYVSFPHGSYNETVLKEVAEAGYTAACSSDFGYFKAPAADRYRLPRITVRRGCGSATFSRLIQADLRFTGPSRLTASLRRAASDMLGLQRYQAIYNAFYGRNKERQ